MSVGASSLEKQLAVAERNVKKRKEQIQKQLAVAERNLKKRKKQIQKFKKQSKPALASKNVDKEKLKTSSDVTNVKDKGAVANVTTSIELPYDTVSLKLGRRGINIFYI